MEHHFSTGYLYHSLILVPFVLAFSGYIIAGILSSRKHHLRPWPSYRYVLWGLGLLCSLSALTGPLAEKAMSDFESHMLGHLLLGMLGPLLLVLAAPVTLLLRALPVKSARNVANCLKSRPVQFMGHPVTVSILNIGGLWLLYTTQLYSMMQHHLWLHLIIHFHVFAAGYLFTAAFIYIDPIPHRYSHLYRAVVFVFALAGHGILSKYIYASPPEGVLKPEAESGAMIMYYGGDLIDACIIFFLCYQWYRAARPRSNLAMREAN
ncbi:cytochrome c oxidase assembly protein [Sediminibacillus massiliensis]|uniref:cytochrome c oxidase assembly protein n=1 Tax=Sediminibacillus massiliensis TaxID=1926277 RepID=UPI0009884ACD|nr:cytochrome c oxidase assembly protein [Sediminibacillus massiliensis]